MTTSIAHLIDIHDGLKKGECKWDATVPGADGNSYGIPYDATRVLQFNPTDKSIREIGPDLGDGGRMLSDGVMADSGVIYCIPYSYDKVIKIDTNDGENNGTVTPIDAALPEKGERKWGSGAKSILDGCIYCMPCNAKSILKINPRDDSFESVGKYLEDDEDGEERKFSGAVADEHGIIYGIPDYSKQIVKFDPTKPDSESTLGNKSDEYFNCGDGVLAMDGNIYASNKKGDILRIDVAKGSYLWILNNFQSRHDGSEWGAPVVGMDKHIYWPPLNANRVMKFNVPSQKQSLVGNKVGYGRYKWWGGALASNGMIYCTPFNAEQVLEINSKPVLEEVGQNLVGDNAAGPDQLGVGLVAHQLAEYLASASLDTPFVLGIIGKWGTGKSYFFNLMKERLIQLQKQPVHVSAENNPYAGHMYCIKFDAWTYGKENLWASLMYRIFKDLSVQLDLESIISSNGKDVLKNGRVSIIELVDKLSTAEMKYLDQILQNEIQGDPNFIQKLIDCQQRQGERVSKPFSAIFKKQVDDDKNELREAMTGLGEQTNMTIWKALEKDGGHKKAVDIFKKIILRKMMNPANKKIKGKLQKQTLLELRADFTLIDNIRVFLNTTPILKLFTLVFIIATISGAIALWETYGQERFANFGIPLGGILANVGALYNFYKKHFDYATECSGKFSDEIKTAQGVLGDVESAYANESDRGIQIEKKKIAEINRRLTIIEGESMQSVVKDRVESDAYLNKLGIVHQAKEDLDRLDAAMRNKYLQEIKPVIPEKKTDNKCQEVKGCFDRIKSAFKFLQMLYLASDADGANEEVVAANEEADGATEEADAAKEEAPGANGNTEAVMFPRGKPRIILFIDDLDRCEPDKVVEVLEAMQLLVKTDLFVVVAAIDLRYVCLSLEQKDKYKNILNRHNSPTGMDFLEKIIQIPYRLPIISDEGMDKFINAQNVQKEAKPKSNDTTNYVDRTDKVSLLSGPPSSGAEQSTPPEAVKGGVIINTSSESNEMNARLQTLDFETPRLQTLDSEEIDVLKKACRIFKPCPRSVKRVVNVFKIMKIVWHKERMKDQDLKKHSILLLVMASSDRTKRGIQEIFNLMEKHKMPCFDDGKKYENLLDLIKEYCSNEFDTGEKAYADPEIGNLLNALELYSFKNDKEWNKISDNFHLPRSFSLFRITEDEFPKQKKQRRRRMDF